MAWGERVFNGAEEAVGGEVPGWLRFFTERLAEDRELAG